MKKALFFHALFFFLAVLQASFLPHFALAGWVINLPLLSLVALASFGSPASGVAAAVAGGFGLDLYSSLPFGSWIILSLLVFFAARSILQNYVRIPQGA